MMIFFPLTYQRGFQIASHFVCDILLHPQETLEVVQLMIYLFCILSQALIKLRLIKFILSV